MLSVRDYETLALNMSEIKRFLQQQKEIIVYYEKAVTPKELTEIEKENKEFLGKKKISRENKWL